MHRSKLLVVVMIAVSLSVGAALSGCSEDKTRVAGRKIRQEADKARRLCEKSMAMMANPVFESPDGKKPPIGQDVDPNAMTLLPLSAVNDRALTEALSPAQDALSKVLEAHEADASGVDKAIGRVTLARVQKLIGHYHAMLADAARDAAAEAVREATGSVSVIRAQAGAIKFHDTLAALSDDDVSGLLKQAEADEGKFKVKVKEHAGHVTALEGEIAKLRGENKTKGEKAGALRLDARLTPGEEGLAKFRKALGIEKEISDNESRIAGKADEIASHKAEMAVLAVDEKAATARVADVKKIIDDRNNARLASKGHSDSLQSAIAKGREDLEAAMAKAAAACDEAAKQEALAMAALNSAATNLHAAREAREQEDPEVLAAQADAYMAMGEIEVRKVELQYGSDRLLKGAGQVLDSKMPPAARKLREYADIAQARKAAQGHYTKAAALYESAMGKVDEKLHWAYHGQAAAAHLAAYRTSDPPDSTLLAAAKKSLANALKGKEASPYLQDVVRLSRLADGSRRSN